MNRFAGLALALMTSGPLAMPCASAAADGSFSMAQVLDYPFESDLVAASHGDAIAWVRNLAGVRNVWVARGPDFAPRQVTRYTADDGQELTQLTFSPDGSRLIFVRGGDHDANWPAEGGLAPDPASGAETPAVTIWSIGLKAGAPVKVAEGDAPALSARGVVAFVKDKQVWTAPIGGKGKAERLFFDRGADGSPAWSPDGRRLAFVSGRGDHAFIGVFTAKDRPILYLAASTAKDSSPRWSPDGTRVAFIRRPGDGGAPEPLLKEVPQPWAIWTADVATGAGDAVWRGPKTLASSYPDIEDEADLMWAAGGRLVFRAEMDGWPHLYSVQATGGEARLLTAGAFMVEHARLSRDGRTAIYDANTGGEADDGDRRHLFAVAVDGGAPMALTGGEGIEDQPVAASKSASGGAVAFIAAGARAAPFVALVGADGTGRRTLNDGGAPADFPGSAFVTPRYVAFKAADGTSVHGQLFQRSDGDKPQSGIIFVHGGPPRQMLLGWHYMDYYSNAYAVNQYLAAHGFTVLSVNYRLGIGYGRAFQHPDKAGPAGASEYQDVVAGARFLQATPGVDPARIGIWGGSYGGYLTALALARNSDIFKAGVDMHGVHDWWPELVRDIGPIPDRFEQGDRAAARDVAWAASPDADIARWRSPVLLIQGDDDRNVDFQQTVDLARRLEAANLPFEELVIPNEIHGFLRHASWLAADTASVAFLEKERGGARK
ncbi:MAG: prolyl oligopeptidase family serine peptidase [Pseudomonadota bacterium]|nr:prolyl oligopeptidase family serine peptidase [Pseudomonadota bacterium]